MIIFAPPRGTAQNMTRNLLIPAPLPTITLFNPEFTQTHSDQMPVSKSSGEKKRFAFRSKLRLVSPTADEINMLSE